MPESLGGKGRTSNCNREGAKWEVSLKRYEVSFFPLNIQQCGTALWRQQKPEQWMLDIQVGAEVQRDKGEKDMTCFFFFLID